MVTVKDYDKMNYSEIEHELFTMAITSPQIKKMVGLQRSGMTEREAMIRTLVALSNTNKLQGAMLTEICYRYQIDPPIVTGASRTVDNE